MFILFCLRLTFQNRSQIEIFHSLENMILSSKTLQSEGKWDSFLSQNMICMTTHQFKENIQSFKFIIVKAIIIHDKTKVVYKLELSQLYRQLLQTNQSYFNELVLLSWNYETSWFILTKCFHCKSTGLDLLVEFKTNVNQERNAWFGGENADQTVPTTDHTVQFVLVVEIMFTPGKTLSP